MPIRTGTDIHSLSAILMDDDYYALVRTQRDLRDGLPCANATALIPLKAKAWLDLTRRKAEGEAVDSKNIAKHRNDVFRLSTTLPGEPGPEIQASILCDLERFLAAFPETSGEWPNILASLREQLGDEFSGTVLRSAIRTYFRLPS